MRRSGGEDAPGQLPCVEIIPVRIYGPGLRVPAGQDDEVVRRAPKVAVFGDACGEVDRYLQRPFRYGTDGQPDALDAEVVRFLSIDEEPGDVHPAVERVGAVVVVGKEPHLLHRAGEGGVAVAVGGQIEQKLVPDRLVEGHRQHAVDVFILEDGVNDCRRPREGG